MHIRYALPFLSIIANVSLHAQGDDCLTAAAVVPGTYTADGPSSGGGASQGDAVNADWYAFTPVVDGYLSIVSCGSQVDTRVNLHQGSCGSLELLASDDHGCPDADPLGGSLIANVLATAGTTYYIEWDDAHSASGFDWQLLLHGCPIAIPTIASGPGSITLDWPVLAAGATFNIEYGPPGFEVGTGTVITGVQGDAQPPVTIAGLTGGASYDIYISVDCGGGNTAPFNGPWHGTAGEPVVLDNDFCEDAITITCGSATEGSTAEAEVDGAPDCGTSVSAAGVWYTFNGVSGTVILTTCAGYDYDTKINVYTGECDDPVCVVGNDDGPYDCYHGSEVIFTADAATTYYVLVQGYNGEVGTFTLVMACPACAPPSDIAVIPTDVLAYMDWTTSNPGAAYTVEYGPDGFTPGTGTVITGTTGVDGPPVTLTGLELATDYDVYLVENCGGGEPGFPRGPISFTTLAEPLPENAFCQGAVSLACGQEADGNTEQGVLANVPECGSAYVDTKGLWFTFTGDGNDATLSTCGTADFDTKISVWSGSCSDLICEGGVDDGPGCTANTSLVTVSTTVGTTYFALVHGYNGATGPFTISMTCSTPCSPAVPNDDCSTAQEITPQHFGACVPTLGTNLCAYTPAQPNPPCDPYSAAYDVWYSFNTGPSAEHTITVATITSDILGLALYSGCGPGAFMDCYDPQTGPIALTGLALNTMYYVQVWNTGGAAAGTFTICDEATLLVSIDELSASTLRAWPSPVEEVLMVDGLAPEARIMHVLDAQGRTVSAQSVGSVGTQVLNTSALAPGAYVLRVEGGMPQAIRFVRR